MAGVLAAQRDRLRARVAQLDEAIAQVCRRLNVWKLTWASCLQTCWADACSHRHQGAIVTGEL